MALSVNAAPPSRAERGQPPVRVLVADDHRLLRTSIRHLLQLEGLEVVGEAEDGEEAVRLAQELRPDVVLMDINMPGIGGVEATRQLARLVPETRVITLTTSADENDVLQAVLAGSCGYLMKDVSLETLVAGIKAAAEGESLVSPSATEALLKRLRAGFAPPAPDQSIELSAREQHILSLIAAGKTSAEIGNEIGLSPKTVRNVVSRLLRKLGLRNRVEAAVWAVRRDVRR